MKKLLLCFLAGTLFTTYSANAQMGKGQRVSPHDTVKTTTGSGLTVEIDYGRPSVKGRTIGKDLEPMEGKVWRAGADEATIFAFNKDVKIEGKTLPAGKYSFFTLKKDNQFTLIFNKTWNIWGTKYEEIKSQDILQVDVKGKKAPSFTEKLTYTLDKAGKVSLTWGDYLVNFTVK